MTTTVHYTSKEQTWETPPAFFAKLDAEFHFTLDPCCQVETAKCAKFYTPMENGLAQDWTGETVFCNPPYNDLAVWIRKCHDEHFIRGATVVMLIPARTDTAAFHKYILGKAEIRFVRGRLKFGGCKDSAPFPSMVVVYR